MRLSDIGADRAMDVLGVLIPRVVAIATDRRVADALRASEGSSGKAEAVAKAAPLLLSEHGDDVIAILAATDGQEADEWKATHTLPQVLQGLVELLTDEEALAFLGSLPAGAAAASSSASGSTGGLGA
jgi:hypothetical protein